MRRPLALGLAAGLFAGCAALLPGGAVAGEPRRIVSLNLCADQMLLALADRDQIGSLSPLAADPGLSYLAGRVGALPVNGGKGEAILFGGADLVLTGTFGQQARTALLRRQGLAVVALDPWRSLADGRRQVRMLAARLGHPERGEALVGAIDDALARSRDIVPEVAPRPVSVLTYYRRGYVPASESLTGELLRHMGFRLHQEDLSLSRGGLARLEAIVMNPPDFLLLDEAAERAVDNGSALLVHPALAAAVPPGRRLSIPGNLTICGGPSLPAAIDALAREIRAKVR
ncbi:MAG: ABC transporter substrate-binding protein [Microvirga sp.]